MKALLSYAGCDSAMVFDSTQRILQPMDILSSGICFLRVLLNTGTGRILSFLSENVGENIRA